DAHFALFCNLGELMRLDGENLSQIFQLRRLMAEVDRTLELNPNHVDAMAAKGTLLVRLPRLLGGDSARGEAMLREVLARDPNAFTTRLALANVCEARGDGAERAAPPGAPPGAPRPPGDADLRPRGAREARPRSVDLRAHRHGRVRGAARDVEPRGSPGTRADARRHAPPRRRHLRRVPDL